MAAALAAGLSVTLLVSGGALALQGRRDRLADRVAAVVGGAATTAARPEAPAESLLRDRGREGGVLERLLSRGRRAERTRIMLERAGLPLRPGEYLMLRLLVGAAGAGAGIPLATVAGLGSVAVLVVLATGFVGFMLPALYVRRRVGQRARLIEEQLVEMTELMASTMSAGFGYMQALVAIAEQIDPPMSDEIRKLVDEVNLGGDVDEALAALNERLESKDFDIVATAITIQRSAGGNLAEILKRVAETVRQRQSFKREVLALTSRERFSALIIAGFPLLLVGVLALMAPEMYGRLFTDTIGRIALAGALSLDALAYFVIKAMTKIEA